MSHKVWIGKDDPGIYTVTATRGPMTGQEIYFGRVWIRSERKCRHFRLGTTISQARRKMRKIMGDPEAALAQRKIKSAPKPMSVEQLIDAFVAGYRPRGDSGFYANIAPWREHFGKVDAARVTRTMVEDFRDAMRRGLARRPDGYSNSSIRSYLTALGTCYRWGVSRGILSDDPALAWCRKGEGVKRPDKPDREVEVLSADEEKKILDVADPPTSIMIRLFLESGMRQGGRGAGEEGMNLRWGQVDRASGAIVIPKSKNGRSRAIPLNVRLTAVLDGATKHLRSDILRRDIEAGRAPAAYVLSDTDGNRLDPWRATRALESAMNLAGIVKKSGPFNLLRHTFGSRLAEKGVSMAVIARIMGNSVQVCERHYIRFSPGHLKAAMATLDTPATVPLTVPPRPDAMESAGSDQQQVVAS